MADAKKAETEAETPPAPKNKGKLIVFIAIGVLVLVLVGGGAAYFLMKKKPVVESVDGEDPLTEVKAKKKDKKGDHTPPAFYKFDKPFTVKLQTEQQEAYLQTEVQLRVLDTAVQEMLKQYEPELKHRIMLILLAKKASDLGTAPGVQRLSNEIRETVNNTLEPPVVKKGKGKVETQAKEPGDVAADRGQCGKCLGTILDVIEAHDPEVGADGAAKLGAAGQKAQRGQVVEAKDRVDLPVVPGEALRSLAPEAATGTAGKMERHQPAGGECRKIPRHSRPGDGATFNPADEGDLARAFGQQMFGRKTAAVGIVGGGEGKARAVHHLPQDLQRRDTCPGDCIEGRGLFAIGGRDDQCRNAVFQHRADDLGLQRGVFVGVGDHGGMAPG